jgi:ComF family protein
MNIVTKHLNGFLDFFLPRQCEICGRRLAVCEKAVCTSCYMILPRTYQWKQPYDNRMVRLFWGRIRVERGAAFLFYQPHSPASHLFYQLKYHDRPDIGVQLGRLAAIELDKDNFFEGIDLIVPLPLSRKRERKRGYNQCYEIARGVAQVKKIPIVRNAMKRIKETPTQTRKNSAERFENVSQAFKCVRPELLNGKHVLMIDDVVTTGASLLSCAEEMQKQSDVLISVFTLGHTYTL